MKRVCKRCVMDDSNDKTIVFYEDGTCNYCTDALKRKKSEYFPNHEGQQRLEQLLATVKKAGKGKKYDCIMGISGGLDSSYLAYLGHKWGLRVLAVHLDDGYVEGQGINLYSVSVQNEPDCSSDWTHWKPAATASFIANYGKAVKQGTKAKLMSAESFQYGNESTG